MNFIHKLEQGKEAALDALGGNRCAWGGRLMLSA